MVTLLVTFLKIRYYLTATVKWDDPIETAADETTMKGVQDLGRRRKKQGMGSLHFVLITIVAISIGPMNGVRVIRES